MIPFRVASIPCPRHVRALATAGHSEVNPLAGVRILDLTRILAGPFCTMLLGDLGAEVIKIEHPQGGDDTRRWGPPFVTSKCGRRRQSCYFLTVNRNKKSVTLDIKSKRGQDIVRRLASKSDVLVENFKPGNLDKLGLGYKELSEVAPHLVYCSISGFGSHGPYVDRGGFDVIAASIGGLLHVTGPADGPPCKVGVALTDICTGLYAHGAILAALRQRDQVTGKGQKIDCNLLSTQVAILANLGSNFINAGLDAKRYVIKVGTAHHSIVPYQAFKTRDDNWITIGCGNDRQFAEFCSRIGRSDLKHEPRFASNELRVHNRNELIAELEACMMKKTLDEWEVVLEGCGFPYGPVNDLHRVFEDKQVKHLRMERVIHHDHLGVDIKQLGPAVEFSASVNDVRTAPPSLGEHTQEVLQNVLGFGDAEIEECISNGVV